MFFVGRCILRHGLFCLSRHCGVKLIDLTYRTWHRMARKTGQFALAGHCRSKPIMLARRRGKYLLERGIWSLGLFNCQYYVTARRTFNCVVCGLEAHICVFQTVRDLLLEGYKVEVLSDSVASRNIQNKQIAIDRINNEGGGISSVEMFLFHLQETSKSPTFKKLSKLVK